MDTLFFIFSKLGWLLLRPETILVFFFALALILLWRDRNRSARRVLALALALTFLIGVFPLGYLVISPLERKYPPNPQPFSPSGIVVLGGAEDPGPAFAGKPVQVNEAGDRLITAMVLARQFPEALVLYSGGRASVKPARQGSFAVGPDVLRSLGLPENRLIVEDRSRTTAENAALSRAMIPENAPGPWVLVTSAYHLPRAMGSFCGAGWTNLIPYATDYRSDSFWTDIGWSPAENLHLLNTAVKEWIGLLAYRITGRLSAGFPAEC